MENTINKKYKRNNVLSIVITLLGVSLLTYMILIEDEPGAVPLFLIFIGIAWFFFNRHKMKKQQ
jgi:hypothetical protein